MEQIIDTDWWQVLTAWMHDPVDKALSIKDHESRARTYLTAALGNDVPSSRYTEPIKRADIDASIADRLPMPTSGEYGERVVSPVGGAIKIYHPVSAERHTLAVPAMDTEAVLKVIRGIVDGLPPDPRARFLALWRLLPDRVSQQLGADFIRLPADTRVPDHSLIQHADISSGISVARQGGNGYAVLSVTLGPVQGFIRAARTVRDLWSGSALLSWLIFQGLEPILEQLGPTALVYPALRGNPLADLWLRKNPSLDKLIELPDRNARRAPSLPNRFVALVPYGNTGQIGERFANACERRIREAWSQLAQGVRDKLCGKFSRIDSDWAQHWDAQIESYFEVTASICPEHGFNDTDLARLIGGAGKQFGDVWEHAQKVRDMQWDIPESDRPRYSQDKAGRWQAQLELSARLSEAQRTIRHGPVISPVEPAAPKCSLLGTYEQMGPADLEESRKFWETVWDVMSQEWTRLRKGERFCALALCKRFASETVLCNELQLSKQDLSFPDTARVAAARWLAEASIAFDAITNGRWLHQRQRCEDEEEVPKALWRRIGEAKKRGVPPSYYAILSMDADHMGRWLKGEEAPAVKDVMHPKLCRYYGGSPGLEAKRPVGPGLHAAISTALNNFASISVPAIVKEFRGTLIYSGGDDVLALLPIRNAIPCALELRKAFRGEANDPSGWTQQQDLAMGNKATLSAGIAFVHYKEDLRAALAAAKQAEKDAKDAGRDRLTLRFMRRSGERPSSNLSWALAPWFQEAVNAFTIGETDRWIYQLRRELHVLVDSELDPEAIKAEICRLIRRSTMNDGLGSRLPEQALRMEQWWAHYSANSEGGNDRLKSFTTLCLGASFVARGYDS